MRNFLTFICLLLPLFGRAEPQKSVPPKNCKEGFVDVPGSQLFCRIVGKGDPLIIIHGGPGLAQDYLQPELFAIENRQLIFYDQRGCGASTGELNPSSINIETSISDLENLRKKLGFEKISILGHSWGGFLAMKYALQYPTHVDKLILVNSMSASSADLSLFLTEWAKRMGPYFPELEKIKSSPGYKTGDPKTIAAYYRLMYKTYCYKPEDADRLNLTMTPKASLNGFKVHELLSESLLSKQFDFYPELKKLKVKTLIIHGDFDPIPQVTAAHLHESIFGSCYVLFKNCGHFSYLEQPEKFFSCVNAFLAT